MLAWPESAVFALRDIGSILVCPRCEGTGAVVMRSAIVELFLGPTIVTIPCPMCNTDGWVLGGSSN